MERVRDYDAFKINPKKEEDWHNRGVAIEDLGRYEEAIASYDRAIKIDSDIYKAWHNRGVAISKLGRYKEAIASYEQAIKSNPYEHITWSNKSVLLGNLHGYKAKISAYNEAFQYIQRDTHPEGWGYLQHQIGSTHYHEGKNQLLNHRRNPQLYYGFALTHYHNALQTLTREDFPKLRIETLIDIAKVYLAQHNLTAAHQCKTEALDILRDLLNAQSTFAGKKRLQIEYSSLSQLDVALFIASNDSIATMAVRKR